MKLRPLDALDPKINHDLHDPIWRRRKALSVIDGAIETKVRFEKSVERIGRVRVEDVVCRFEVDREVVGYCILVRFAADTLETPEECHFDIDCHSREAGRMCSFLVERFDELVFDYGHVVLFSRIHFLPDTKPFSWIKPFEAVLGHLYSDEGVGFMIGKPFPLEYEGRREATQTPGFRRRNAALKRLYVRAGFEVVSGKDDDYVWRALGPRCTPELIRGLILPDAPNESVRATPSMRP